MKRTFFFILTLSLLFCAEFVSARTLTVLNLTGMTTNLITGSLLVFPPGRSDIELTPSLVVYFNSSLGTVMVDGSDYEWVSDLTGVVSASEVHRVDYDLWPSFQLGMGSAFLICGFGWFLRMAKKTGGAAV